MGRVGLLAAARVPISGDVIAAGHPEPDFLAGAAARDAVSAAVSAAFVVRLEAGFVVQGGAVLPQLQAGGGRPNAGLLVPLAAGGSQLGGGRRVWFTDLRACLSQQGQGTLLGVQLQQQNTGVILFESLWLSCKK